MYLLCLIDWENRILNCDEHKELAKRVLGKNTQIRDNWTIKKSPFLETLDEVSKAEIGFYHSRLIFKFKLTGKFNEILDIREVREKIEKEVSKYCEENIIPFIEKDERNKNLKRPHIFGYSIFELDSQSDFWTSEGKRPFSMQTTCFYTELDDSPSLKHIFSGGRVKMRISGAKIITTPMSDWFFNNLVNLVFHEGLYRLIRSRNNNIKTQNSTHFGLEKRVEDFASEMLTTFHSYSSEYFSRNLQKLGLILAIIAGSIGIITFGRAILGI